MRRTEGYWPRCRRPAAPWQADTVPTTTSTERWAAPASATTRSPARTEATSNMPTPYTRCRQTKRTGPAVGVESARRIREPLERLAHLPGSRGPDDRTGGRLDAMGGAEPVGERDVAGEVRARARRRECRDRPGAARRSTSRPGQRERARRTSQSYIRCGMRGEGTIASGGSARRPGPRRRASRRRTRPNRTGPAPDRRPAPTSAANRHPASWSTISSRR